MRWALILGEDDDANVFRREFGSESVLVSRDGTIRDQYGIKVTPYAVLIAVDGTVIAKGLVNTMEHLESILEVLSRWRTSAHESTETSIGQAVEVGSKLDTFEG